MNDRPYGDSYHGRIPSNNQELRKSRGPGLNGNGSSGFHQENDSGRGTPLEPN